MSAEIHRLETGYTPPAPEPVAPPPPPVDLAELEEIRTKVIKLYPQLDDFIRFAVDVAGLVAAVHKLDASEL